MIDDKKERSPHQLWAEFRFGVIGGLLSAPCDPRALAAAFRGLTSKEWMHPIKKIPVRFGISTIERWYYQAKKKTMDPVGALRTKLRSDSGKSYIGQEIKDWLNANHREHSSWSYQLHTDNLRVWLTDRPQKTPSYSSVLRFMKNKGYWKTPRARSPLSPAALAARERLTSHEVRLFETAYVGGLWHLDFHHGSRQILTLRGERVTPLCLCILDDHSRLCCHIQWYLSEDTEKLVHGFIQALQKRGVPRALLSDNGSAMISSEFTEGLVRLGVIHETTLPHSPYQNGKQESFWGNLEARLMAMLENDKELNLHKLNFLTQAWAEVEYNKEFHKEINDTPLNRFLHAKDVLRPSPNLADLQLLFRQNVKRKQRRSDGTFSLESIRFEIPSAWKTLQRITVRYARWDLTLVHLIDETTQGLLARLYPVNLEKNAEGVRRTNQPRGQSKTEPLSNEAPPLLKRIIEEYSSSGLPPAYIPFLNEEEQ